MTGTGKFAGLVVSVGVGLGVAGVGEKAEVKVGLGEGVPVGQEAAWVKKEACVASKVTGANWIGAGAPPQAVATERQNNR